MKELLCGTLLALMPLACHAQAPKADADPFHLTTSAEIKKQAAELIQQAQKSDSGSVSVTLEKYQTHFTMLSARVKSGGGEKHEHWSDFLIVVEGEGKEIVGGTLAGAKAGNAPGEWRGTGVEGGTTYDLHPGDVIHVLAGTPHQQISLPGKPLVCYVIKVAEKQ